MSKLIFITHDGARHEIDGTEGISVMENAVQNGVPGIDADCGGQCSCATCHVFVEGAWADKCGALEDMEESMLDLNPERQPTSRLSCQIIYTDALDGLTVHVPEFQG
jgi:2Fe-2S ferredoxin